MPELDRDKYRKVSEPTQADFIRGFAHEATKNNKKGLASLTAAVFLSKALRRFR